VMESAPREELSNLTQRTAISAPRLVIASTPCDESRSPPEAESTSVPEEVMASTQKESQRTQLAIRNVNRIPACGWMKHSYCSEFEIEDTWTAHTTVSEQAEQVRVITAQRATGMDDRSRREIPCRQSEGRTEFCVE